LGKTIAHGGRNIDVNKLVAGEVEADEVGHADDILNPGDLVSGKG
jgi:hypothetical protein